MSKIRFVGLDVHAETVAVAVAEPNGLIREQVNAIFLRGAEARCLHS